MKDPAERRWTDKSTSFMTPMRISSGSLFHQAASGCSCAGLEDLSRWNCLFCVCFACTFWADTLKAILSKRRTELLPDSLVLLYISYDQSAVDTSTASVDSGVCPSVRRLAS